jgi:hypothetical protein
MSDIPIPDLFAPEGGWRVRILDLSGASEDNVVEIVPGFPTLMQASSFARRYVRDSVERCRAPGLSTREVLDAWFAYGEDAEIVDGGDDAWRSGNELHDFATNPASDEERDWRAFDPRLGPSGDEDET